VVLYAFVVLKFLDLEVPAELYDLLSVGLQLVVIEVFVYQPLNQLFIRVVCYYREVRVGLCVMHRIGHFGVTPFVSLLVA